MKTVQDLIDEAAIMAIGWAYADCCTTLDNGKDPRHNDMAEVLARARKDLGDQFNKEGKTIESLTTPPDSKE